MSKDFVHLTCHSDYSLLESIIQFKPLVKKLKELDMDCIALTDSNNMFGAISFQKTLSSEKLKGIIGTQIRVKYIYYNSNLSDIDKSNKTIYGLISLLVMNEVGYNNLIKISSELYLNSNSDNHFVSLEYILRHQEGLILLSGNYNGLIDNAWKLLSHTDNNDEFNVFMHRLKNIWEDRIYLELQNHGFKIQNEINQRFLDLCRIYNISPVVTNDCRFLVQDEYDAHDTICALHSSSSVNDVLRLRFSQNHYLKSKEEMWELFEEISPEGLINSKKIADRCNFSLRKGINYLPEFPVSNGFTEESLFILKSREGLKKRKQIFIENNKVAKLKHSFKEYDERLEYELQVITKMGFAGYFLVVADFISWAKNNNIPVGISRGSVGGSLVAYALDIIEIDPMQYGLFFERFLNPERVSLPDIDVDFCIRGRQRVIEYVTELYGRDRVCQIITFGTMGAKTALKDIGKAFNMPFYETNKITAMLPPPVRGHNISLQSAIMGDERLQFFINSDPLLVKVINIAKKIEGCARHSSLHAAGIIISPKLLTDLIPLYKTAENQIASQYEMGDLEDQGMIKMDFLGLAALTMIDDCIKLIKSHGHIVPDFTLFDYDDPRVYEIFANGDTDAIFQFESEGMKDICKRLQSSCLEDLSALNALYRPGPIDAGFIDRYIERKHGREEITYDIPDLSQIMDWTYGVLVYQEQIMSTFRFLADYSLGDADLVRRAMGKKKRDEMEMHKQKFLSKAIEKGYPEDKLLELWEQIFNFSDYCFNLAHSMAYSAIAYQTAWLKAYYPEYFWVTVLTQESGNTDKIVKYISIIKNKGIKLLNPSINSSNIGFSLENYNNCLAIRFGLQAIKGIGEASLKEIVEIKEKERFLSLEDFIKKITKKSLNKKAMEVLGKSGALDELMPENFSLNQKRASILENIENILSFKEKSLKRQKNNNQPYLFEELEKIDLIIPKINTLSRVDVLKNEKEVLGYYISGHPLDIYREFIKNLDLISISYLTNKLVSFKDSFDQNIPYRILCVTLNKIFRMTKKNEKFLIATAQDNTDEIKLIIWPKTLKKIEDKLSSTSPFILTGFVEENDSGELTFFASDLLLIDNLISDAFSQIIISVSSNNISKEDIDSLLKIIEKHPGNSFIELHIISNINSNEKFILSSIKDKPLMVNPSAILFNKLMQVNRNLNIKPIK